MKKPNDSKIKEVYDKIAESFYRLRQYTITPEIEKISGEWKPGKLLDIGCGIGNSMILFAKKGFDCIGLDISTKQLEYAEKYAKKNNVEFQLVEGSMIFLPFKTKFDYIISVAALHHLDSENKRLKALEEMKKVLKPNGEIFLSVWNQRISTPTVQIRSTCLRRAQFPSLGTSSQHTKIEIDKDVYIPWKIGDKEYYRYYYFFEKNELKNLLEKAEFQNIEIYEDKDEKNICVRATKP